MSACPRPNASSAGTKQQDKEPCSLFALTQYECSPAGGKLTCWPLERVFRKCGNGPAFEVTNFLVDQKGEAVPTVAPGYIAHPPKGKKWADLR